MSAEGQPPLTDAGIILGDATPTEYGRCGNVTESERGQTILTATQRAGQDMGQTIP
jgi:hypothetical protein